MKNSKNLKKRKVKRGKNKTEKSTPRPQIKRRRGAAVTTTDYEIIADTNIKGKYKVSNRVPWVVPKFGSR